MNTQETATFLHDWFNRDAGDLYPGRFTPEYCRQVAEMNVEIQALAKAQDALIVAHYYQLPECQWIAGKLGDSLKMAQDVRDSTARMIYYLSVYFMAQTGKALVGDAKRIFTCDTPQALGCSLVFGTDHGWIDRWIKRNPGGLLLTYVNSDAALKAKSHYVTTSRNTAKAIVRALVDHPTARLLVLPDKFLGHVMKHRALQMLAQQGADAAALAAYAKRIDVYDHSFKVIAADGGSQEFHACCEVHEKIGPDAPERMLDEHPDAELLLHPECGCASECLIKLDAGILPAGRVHYQSTEQMIDHVLTSSVQTFVVGTEAGHVWQLRQRAPHKTFVPVDRGAMCRFMKGNTVAKLLDSMRRQRLETVFCDDCCDPKEPYQDDQVVHLPRSTAAAAKSAIDNMMAIN